MPRPKSTANDIQICLDAATLQLFELLPETCFFVKDRLGKLIHCNETHRRTIFRYSNSAELYGKANHDFFPNTLANAFTTDDEQVIKRGATIWEKCELNITAAGVLSWFCTTKLPARNQRGQTIGLIGISRVLKPADERLEQFALLSPAIEMMKRKFSVPLRITEIVQACSMTESTFRREFQRAFRMTPLQFLMRLRLHEACMRLTSTAQSIGEIATQSGFEDQNYFTRFFHKLMGITPSQFRQKQRRGVSAGM
jgi:AraC-like DNA-binding protein